MKELSTKTTQFTESVIRGMTAVANKYNAINLGQGFPEFAPPVELLDRLEQVSHDPKFQQYPMGHGQKNTRDALAKKYERYSGLKVDADNEIVITCGGTEAMVASLMTICNKGDKVAIFTPMYENYKTACILADAEPVYVALNPDKNYTFDKTELEKVFSNNLKALILCNPSNPCGKVFTIEEMTFIAELTKKYDVYIITDEVYEHMVYDNNKMVYMATLPDMKDRTIICSSMSKTYSITGWRIGYVIAPKSIMDSIKKVHNFLTIGAPTPLQEAVVVGLSYPQSYYDKLLKMYSSKMNIMCDGFDTIGIKYHRPQGTYFMLIDLSEYVKKSGLATDFEFATMLCEKIGVCVVPCETLFVGEKRRGWFRMHFAKEDETLHEALKRFEKIKELF